MRETTKGWLTFAIVLSLPVIVVLAAAGKDGGPSTDESATAFREMGATDVKTRTEQIEESFSTWDGSHMELTKVIKASLNDPDSYKHDETIYVDQGDLGPEGRAGDQVWGRTRFRARNGFGGVVRMEVAAEADLDGNIIQVFPFRTRGADGEYH